MRAPRANCDCPSVDPMPVQNPGPLRPPAPSVVQKFFSDSLVCSTPRTITSRFHTDLMACWVLSVCGMHAQAHGPSFVYGLSYMHSDEQQYSSPYTMYVASGPGPDHTMATPQPQRCDSDRPSQSLSPRQDPCTPYSCHPPFVWSTGRCACRYPPGPPPPRWGCLRSPPPAAPQKRPGTRAAARYRSGLCPLVRSGGLLHLTLEGSQGDLLVTIDTAVLGEARGPCARGARAMPRDVGSAKCTRPRSRVKVKTLHCLEHLLLRQTGSHLHIATCLRGPGLRRHSPLTRLEQGRHCRVGLGIYRMPPTSLDSVKVFVAARRTAEETAKESCADSRARSRCPLQTTSSQRLYVNAKI